MFPMLELVFSTLIGTGRGEPSRGCEIVLKSQKCFLCLTFLFLCTLIGTRRGEPSSGCEETM